MKLGEWLDVRSAEALGCLIVLKHHIPFERARLIARAAWPNEVKAAQVTNDIPQGACKKCGAQFAAFIACERTECDWSDAPEQTGWVIPNAVAAGVEVAAPTVQVAVTDGWSKPRIKAEPLI
jgi:hypothetical protein